MYVSVILLELSEMGKPKLSRPGQKEMLPCKNRPSKRAIPRMASSAWSRLFSIEFSVHQGLIFRLINLSWWHKESAVFLYLCTLFCNMALQLPAVKTNCLKKYRNPGRTFSVCLNIGGMWFTLGRSLKHLRWCWKNKLKKEAQVLFWQSSRLWIISGPVLIQPDDI